MPNPQAKHLFHVNRPDVCCLFCLIATCLKNVLILLLFHLYIKWKQWLGLEILDTETIPLEISKVAKPRTLTRYPCVTVCLCIKPCLIIVICKSIASQIMRRKYRDIYCVEHMMFIRISAFVAATLIVVQLTSALVAVMLVVKPLTAYDIVFFRR